MSLVSVEQLSKELMEALSANQNELNFLALSQDFSTSLELTSEESEQHRSVLRLRFFVSSFFYMTIFTWF